MRKIIPRCNEINLIEKVKIINSMDKKSRKDVKQAAYVTRFLLKNLLRYYSPFFT